MSYMRLGNHQIRENGHRRSIFDKVNEIRQDLKTLFPEVEDDRWIAIFSHCRNFHRGNLHYGRKGSKTERPRELSEIIENLKKEFPYIIRTVDSELMITDEWTPGFKNLLQK